MARAPKNGKSGPTETVATTLLMPTASVLDKHGKVEKEGVIAKLSKAKRNSRKNAREATQAFSTKFATAQEEQHVDRRAANIAFNLDALSDDRLHVTYFHLLRYMDDLGIPARATAQQELLAEHKGEEEETGDGEKDAESGNVTQIGAAARRVAEKAGADA